MVDHSSPTRRPDRPRSAKPYDRKVRDPLNRYDPAVSVAPHSSARRELLALPAWPRALGPDAFVVEGWDDAEDVREACRRNRVRDLLGGDEKAQRALSRAIERVPSASPVRALAAARRVASSVLDRLQDEPLAIRLAVTGALRRMTPTVDAIELLASSPAPHGLLAAFTALPIVRSHEIRGGIATADLADGARVRLGAIEEDGPAFVLLQTISTGPATFVDRLREHAGRRGLAWTDRLAGADGRPLPLETEADLFAALDLPFVPPERREAVARGEAIGNPVDARMLRGLAGLHGMLGAGRFPTATLVDAAAERGFVWSLLLDRAHGPGPCVGPGDLDRERARGPASALFGVRIDLERPAPSFVREEADIVLGEEPTRGLLESFVVRAEVALGRGDVDVLGAWPAPLDRAPDLEAWRRAIDAARDAGAAIAIAGSRRAAPPPDGLGSLVRSARVPVLLDADETLPGELDQALAALGLARREALPPDLIINTWALDDVRAWLRRRRAAR